ncbi:MAG: uncharacterized protein A8A55_1645 [Amphiamblys sp. WSBS2006]|nr:MAG: uncharacterized protein A8A55_1645 [Amphiamblys sp. WSBS2006]
MVPGEMRTLKHKNIFFVFTHQSLFLFPENEYSHFQQDKEGCVCLKRKYLSEVTDRDVERIICIVCHEEAALEDFVSPLCRQMHFVLCRACVEYLKGRTDKSEVACPYCKEKRGDKAYQEEILGALFSLMSRQTLNRLELRPDTEVKTVTELTRETKVVLSNIAISDCLFFSLLSRTTTEITNSISIFGHNSYLDCCIWEYGRRTRNPATLCSDGYTGEEMKQIHENIKTIPGKSIQFDAAHINAKGDGICVLPRLLDCVDGHILELSLESSQMCREEILRTENSSLWVGKVKKIHLEDYAIEILPKLRIHGENEMEELELNAGKAEHITRILKNENNSIWVGKVKNLGLSGYTMKMLPKLGFHEENVLGRLFLYGRYPGYPAEMFKPDNTVWVGKVKELGLCENVIEILPKLRLHRENVMEVFDLDANHPEYIYEILKTKNSSIWLGKIKKLKLRYYAVEILPKLRIHEENVMEVLELDVEYSREIAQTLKMKRESIWVGKVKKLVLERDTVRILPKLRIHKENVMEEFLFFAEKASYIAKILKTENNSIWIGKVRRLILENYAIQTLPKLRMHEEDELEELGLWANKLKHITGMPEEEDNSIWTGKAKKLVLTEHAVRLLPKLRIHEESVVEELRMDENDTGSFTGILGIEDKNIVGWVGKVKRLEFSGHAVNIFPKLGLNEENEIEELVFFSHGFEHIVEMLRTKDSSIWIGKMRRLKLRNSTIEILPKLRLNEENVIEELDLSAEEAEYVAGMLGVENKNILGWIRNVKKLKLGGHAVNIFPRIGLHEENEIEELVLDTYNKHECVAEIEGMERNSIWTGKMKRLKLTGYAVGILPKLRIHGESVMEELRLKAKHPGYITEILKEERNSIWIGKIRKISLEGYTKEIENKLDFTLIAPDCQEENEDAA